MLSEYSLHGMRVRKRLMNSLTLIVGQPISSLHDSVNALNSSLHSLHHLNNAARPNPLPRSFLIHPRCSTIRHARRHSTLRLQPHPKRHQRLRLSSHRDELFLR